MDQSSLPSPRANGKSKESFKELNLGRSQAAAGNNGRAAGRESPESGSLYSDYESGQQYEDKDLPSGYNSGEQYDTMSTGYMSGEAYELPEAREPLMEPTLASVEEISGSLRSEDLFTLTHSQASTDGNMLAQTELLESSSSSSIPEAIEPLPVVEAQDEARHKMKRKKKDFPVVVPENSLLMQTENLETSSSSSIPKNMDLAAVLDPITLHKLKMGKKMAKKSVSYHVSVPIDKSPLGHEVKSKIPRTVLDNPSDTDTTSCFDSDGTYMRSECQSSDSAAQLLHKSKSRRGRSRDREAGDNIIRGNRKKVGKKAKYIIRNSADFFDRYDNKYWAISRQVCFWASTLSIIASIIGAVVLIGLMPKTCDPEVQWWQGKLTLDIIPRNRTDGPPAVDIVKLIYNIPRYKRIGVQTLKLKHLYLSTPDSDLNPSDSYSWLPLESELAKSRISQPELLSTLALELHNAGMTLMVEIPAFQGNTTDGKMDYMLERAIMTAVVTWAEKGVDGISIVGLEHFSGDPFLPGNVRTWSTKFQQYGTSPNTKILAGPTRLPSNIEAVFPAGEGNEELSAAFTGIQSFNLLDTTLNLGSEKLTPAIVDAVAEAAMWDLAPSQPWINWALQGKEVDQLSNAELTFLMFLPGTVSLGQTHWDEDLVERLAKIRAAAVPIFMNGNYKTCHGHCTNFAEKELNHVVHVLEDNLLLLERSFSRRNRYMVVANVGTSNSSLHDVSKLYAGGELILDTHNPARESQYVDFKDAELPGMQAYVIKFPK